MKTKLLLACLSSLLSACGGGGDSSENTPTSSVVTTDVQKAVMSGNASLVKDSNQFIEEIERLNSRHVAVSNAIKKTINGGAQSLYWVQHTMPLCFLQPMGSMTAFLTLIAQWNLAIVISR